MRWHKFKRVMPRGRGFYVLRYGDSRPDLSVYLSAREDLESYWVVTENPRGTEWCHDLGHCIWPLGYSGYTPTQWRNMGPAEALRFSRRLYQFGREYFFGTEVRSRGALTMASSVIYNRG